VLVDLGLHDRVVVIAGDDATDREAAALRAEGAQPVLVEALVDAASTVERVVQERGRIDGVVMYLPGGGNRTLLGAHLADLYASWQAVEAVAATFRAAVPAMTGRGFGRLLSVTTGSVKWLSEDTDELATLAGLGVLGLHKSAVADVARSGIAVNAVLRGDGADRQEVAQTVAFLLSEPAGYLHGVTISLDGARSPAVF
jgi:NAD(P)-dependent dehydrogenase (short-subunit alcohol dehydrogenase family)